MPHRKRRLDKKLHRYYLELGVIDASQASVWRRRLFAAADYQEFHINREHTEGLPHDVVRAIKFYGLEYTVCKIPFSATIGWDGYEACVFFKFQACRYPTVWAVTANNPAVV